MAFAAALAPYLAAGTAAYSAVKSGQAATFNSQVATNEANVSVDQANAASGIQRRVGREALGKQAAAFGAAGVGYGGSSETALDQSAVNAELDALNTKYKGSTTAYGYQVQAGQDKSEASQYNLMAGAALLKGAGSNYSYAPGTPPQPSTAQSGTPQQ